MFLVDWFISLLKFLGLLSSVDKKVLFLGLDNSGKTTLLYKLSSNYQSNRSQAHYPNNQETIQISPSCKIIALDLGGRMLRTAWRTYCLGVTGIVFMVDAKDPSRFNEAHVELSKFLNDGEFEHIPFVVLGNKVEHPNAVSENTLSDALGITGLRTGQTTGNKRPLELFMISILRDTNVTEALEWLVAQM